MANLGMNLNNALAIGAMVNPMAGFLNEPSLTILTDDSIKLDPLAIWHRSGPFYFHQSETGVTSYFYHSKKLVNTGEFDEDGVPILQTETVDRGYGGTTFSILLSEDDGLKWAHLRGPWSSRPGCVNPYLMQHQLLPCFECGLRQPGNSVAFSSNLSIRRVRQLLRRYCPNWDLQLDEEAKAQGEHTFNLVYRDQRKKDMPKHIVEMLQDQYEKLSNNLRRQ